MKSDAGKASNPSGFVLGEKAFAAISAIEGLKLEPSAESRLLQNACLPPAERRAQTIDYFRKAAAAR